MDGGGNAAVIHAAARLLFDCRGQDQGVPRIRRAQKPHPGNAEKQGKFSLIARPGQQEQVCRLCHTLCQVNAWQEGVSGEVRLEDLPCGI